MRTVFIFIARERAPGGTAAWLQLVDVVFIAPFSKSPMPPFSGWPPNFYDYFFYSADSRSTASRDRPVLSPLK